jgi:hypothetical protein
MTDEDRAALEMLIARVADVVRECDTPEHAGESLIIAGWRPPGWQLPSQTLGYRVGKAMGVPRD